MKVNIKKSVSFLVIVLLIFITLQTSFATPPNEETTSETVIYEDGTLIINEPKESRGTNTIKHGKVSHVYEPYDGTNYAFSSPEEVIWSESRDSIKAIEVGTIIKPDNTSYWFSNLKKLKYINIDNIDFSSAANISYMFAGSEINETGISENIIKVNDKCKTEDITSDSNINIKLEIINEAHTKNIEIKLSNCKNGTLSFSDSNNINLFSEGENVNIKVTPDDNYMCDSVNVKEQSGDFYTLHVKNNNAGFIAKDNAVVSADFIEKTEKKYNKHITKKIVKEIKTISERDFIIPEKAKTSGEKITVSLPGSTYSYDSSGSFSGPNIHGFFTSDNNSFGAVYCGEHDQASPVPMKGKKSLYASVYNDDVAIRKILYYGYRGMKPWEGFSNSKYNSVYQLFNSNYAKTKTQACGNAVTAMALSYRYSDYANGRGTNWKVSGLAEFQEYLRKMPAPPKAFVVYRIKSDYAFQDLFTWKYNPYGNLKINKKSNVQNDPDGDFIRKNYGEHCNLAGATFEVYRANPKTHLNIEKIGTYTSDKNGNVPLIRLKEGYYRFHEIKGANGHSFDSGIWFGRNVNGGVTTEVNVFNKVRRCKISVNKLRPTTTEMKEWVKRYPDELFDRTLKGAKFNIYLSQTDAEKKVNSIASIITDKNGYGEVTLPLKNPSICYFIRETVPSKGYRLNENIYKWTLANNESHKFNLIEPYSFGYLKIIKKTKTLDDPIAVKFRNEYPEECNRKGAVFEVYRANPENNKIIGTEPVATVTSDINGETTELRLPSGYYCYHEIEGANGHSFNKDKWFYCTIKNDEKNTPYIFNQVRRCTLALQKEKSNDNYWKEWEKRFSDSEYNRTFEGAVFGIYKNSVDAEMRKNEIATVKTDRTGYGETDLPIKNLAAIYYLREITAPGGYNLNEQIYKYNFKDNDIFTFKVTEPYKSISFKVIKRESDDKYNMSVNFPEFYNLEGAEFTIFKDSNCTTPLLDSMGNKVIVTVNKDFSGEYITKPYDLPINGNVKDTNFFLKETKAPVGYELCNDIFEISNKNNNIIIVNNSTIKGYGRIIKVDEESGKPLGNATFNIYKTREDAEAMKNKISSIITDKSGIGETVLPTGMFYIREAVAPEGYSVNREIYEFKIEKDKLTDITISNKKIIEEKEKGRISLRKRIKSDENVVKNCPLIYNLKNAEYTIYNDKECNKAVGILITDSQKNDKNGSLYADSSEVALNEGTYYVKETHAPYGYKKDEKIYSVYIKSNENYLIEVEDEPLFSDIPLYLEKFVKNWVNPEPELLAGAEYMVKYYPAFYNDSKNISKEEQIKNATPLRTWVFRTDKNGKFDLSEKYKVRGDNLFIKSDGLAANLYGTYSFEEITPPEGFAKNEGISISELHQNKEINPININFKGDVNVADEKTENTNRKIIITKKISKDNVYKPFGVPTAIFQCIGEDIYGKEYEYTKAVILDENTFDGNYYSGIIEFDNLAAGKYIVSEIITSKYNLDCIKDISQNGKLILKSDSIQHLYDKSVGFQLIKDKTGHACFYDVINNWGSFTDRECIINRF